ncbi:hypothetical protein [Curtobacterium aetherium]|uniref:Uncharacterized protein n=1 Tax=Curtobacterium aetherium TaxID=2841594 RepID=A0ACD1E6S8_9MICO|nr:hypothetical protein [Curtobacterium sp. L6-1]QWS34571.1 hypothetical protein KM842_05340 [Curtobacterium sp. L6-1]
MASKTLLRPVRPPTGRPDRVSFPDRVALRIGLALIVWSRRTRRQPHETDPAAELRRHRADQERRARDAEWLLLLSGAPPWR